MAIIANHVNGQVALGANKFLQINTNHVNYANEIKTAFKVVAKDGDSDHFTTMETKISHFAASYAGAMATKANFKDILNKEENTYLRSWFSAFLCCLIYGFEDNMCDIHIAGEPLTNGAFLKVWKKKFEKTGGLNCNDGTVLSGNIQTPESGCTVGNYNYITMDCPASNLGYHNIVGTFHDQMLVIPLKDYNFDQMGGNIPEWKMKYLYLCTGNTDFNTPIKPTDTYVWENFVDRLETLSVKQKLLALMSANSIATTSPKPLLFAADMIRALITLPKEIPVPEAVPAWKVIDGIGFFKTDTFIDLNSLFDDTLYIGTQQNSYYATYPFSEKGVEFLRAKGQIKNLSLSVQTEYSDRTTVLSADLGYSVETEIPFIYLNAAKKQETYRHRIVYSSTKTYSAKDKKIKWIQAVPTFCMYPNLPSCYEHRCSKFRYFSVEGSLIMLDNINGLGDAVDVSEGLFMGSLDGVNTNKKIIDYSPGSRPPYNNIKAYGKQLISTTEATKPEHFIKLSNQYGMDSYGYILNLRTLADGELPSLLPDNTTVNVGVEEPVNTFAATPNEELRAYIDFGSSTSYVRYEIGTSGGIGFYKNIVDKTSTLRKCLSKYISASYSSYINDPETNLYNKFLSMSSKYQDGVTEFLPYVHAWMPIVHNYSSLGNIGGIKTSHKTDLARSANPDLTSSKVIITNILYTIACNAVINNCNKVVIVPSFPSEDYKNQLTIVWTQAQALINSIFGSLTFNNYFHYGNDHFLYESIAVTLGTSGLPRNALNVNIDIGDGTTDMSAVFVNNGGKIHLCGYSSIEYAGKDLIKKVIRDILAQDQTMIRNHLIGSLETTNSYGTPIFDPHKDGSDNTTLYIQYITDLIENKNNDDYVESKIMDILDIAVFGGGAGQKDQKVAANFIIRYMLLMPVIKDFVLTAIKIVGDQKINTISILFQGGASKGIDLFGSFDKRATNARTLLNRYFEKAFKGYSTKIQVNVSTVDDKETLAKGLSKVTENAGYLGINGMTVAAVKWDEEVNPKYTEAFGTDTSVHINALKTPFVFTGDTGDDKEKNDAIINNTESYYENHDDPFKELLDFYNDEIYGQLIDNIDGVKDPIEVLTADFLKKATENMKTFANEELLGFTDRSFVRATQNSCIYPEMMKSATFMFTLSKMLSKFHGTYDTTGSILDNGKARTNKFGG